MLKRIVRKHWDEVNGRLVADYWRLYEHNGSYETARLTRFVSPFMLSSPDKAKGRMFKPSDTDKWYTRQQVQVLNSIFKEANNA